MSTPSGVALGGGPGILVVEDEPLARRLLEAVLSQEGFPVMLATCGKEGRQLAAEKQPELILLDIHMPDESGFETCAHLKADPRTADIPVVFISAADDIQAKVRGFDVGGVDYITKPYQRAEVVARVRVHVRLGRATRAMVQNEVQNLKSIRDAQQSSLPLGQDLPEAKFEVVYRPRCAAGGDIYDVLKSGQGIHDFIIADVSGHDLGSAMATASLRGLLRLNASLLHTPTESIRTINQVLRETLPEGQYVTLMFARLNRRSRRLTVINAGHPPALCIRQDGGEDILDRPGDILGAFETPIFDVQELRVNPGDRIYLCTDGVLETDGNQAVPRNVGWEAMRQRAAASRGLSLKEAVAGIADPLLPQTGAAFDDIIVLGIEV